VQNSDTDLHWMGENIQLKTSKTSSYGLYYFNLHHGRAGTKHRRPYEPGIALVFVVVGCPRFDYFSKEDAKKHHLVGEGATTKLALPHPESCALDRDNLYFPFLYPRPRV
jgi:hypothetical protein